MRPNRHRPAPRPHAGRARFSTAPRVRAGLVVSRHMDFGDLGDVESLMVAEGLTLAPMTVDGRPVDRVIGPPHGAITVIPTADMGDVSGGGLAGVVVPGCADDRSAADDIAFDEMVCAAQAGDIPVIAFGDGVARTLTAVGFEPPAAPPVALMIHDGVRILETADEVRDALKVFTASQARRRAEPGPTRPPIPPQHATTTS